MGRSYEVSSKERIKTNGIIFLQDQRLREEVNMQKALDSMDRLLRSWSTRHLTLLGRIIIIKSYAVSQLIYLRQSMFLSESSCKSANRVIFKYLWNKHYDAARAPERLKRSIMLTPVKWGGFGLIDINALFDSLALRSYGRLITSKHPFLSQLIPLINNDDLFNVRINAHVDCNLTNSLELLNKARLKMLNWPIDTVLNNACLVNALMNTKLKNLLNPAGRQSLNYNVIQQRGANRCAGQVTVRELKSVAKFLKYRQLFTVLEQLVGRGALGAVSSLDAKAMYPIEKDKIVVNVAGISSKMFRLNDQRREDMICLYKQGLVLTPGEVIHWTNRLKKLTSTRHKNIILRVAHGDIFSNERLCRFGLINDPKCQNCEESAESINHRLIDCPKATSAWNHLESLKLKLGLEPLVDLTMESILGAKGNAKKLELALNAELQHKLSATGNTQYCPKTMAYSVVKIIGNCENLNCTQIEIFKEVINEM